VADQRRQTDIEKYVNKDVQLSRRDVAVYYGNNYKTAACIHTIDMYM